MPGVTDKRKTAHMTSGAGSATLKRTSSSARAIAACLARCAKALAALSIMRFLGVQLGRALSENSLISPRRKRVVDFLALGIRTERNRAAPRFSCATATPRSSLTIRQRAPCSSPNLVLESIPLEPCRSPTREHCPVQLRPSIKAGNLTRPNIFFFVYRTYRPFKDPRKYWCGYSV